MATRVRRECYRRVVVVGLDGFDPARASRLMAKGGLTNLARMASRGAFSPLATTLPAQTPSAWSTFATGVNPGGHGIYDFLRRDPRTYRPEISLFRIEQRSRLLPPRAINIRGGRPVWERLSEVGTPSTVIRCPGTFPPAPFRGRLLAGVGVPDLQGGIGTPTWLSASPPAVDRGVRHLRLTEDGSWFRGSLTVQTPSGPAELAAALRIESSGVSGTLHISGAVAHMQQGEWTDWLEITLRASAGVRVRCVAQVFAADLGPGPALYLGPLNMDPREPAFPISHPWGYASELAATGGRYGTLGMLEDHAGLEAGCFGEDAFLAQVHGVFEERRRMFLEELSRREDGLVFGLFDTPDRVQHMFWRYDERDHPASRTYTHEKHLENTIETLYERCDALVGEVLSQCSPDSLVLVVSDHGFCGFRRGVELNRWLWENGWLAYRSGVEVEDPGLDGFGGVDWERTRAYAIGFGGIYLNVAGREAAGIVQPGDRRDVSESLRRALAALLDPVTGEAPIRGVSLADEVYRGDRTADAPDLVVRFDRGYRAGWRSATGGLGGAVFADNVKRWAGDHIVDPVLVPGVLFSSAPLTLEGVPWLGDCAPTILAALHGPSILSHPVAAGLEGRDLMHW